MTEPDFGDVKNRPKADATHLPFQQRLSFPEISVGAALPLQEKIVDLGDAALSGRPASSGVVEGIARVAHTLAEAAELKPGEILVTPITDIGWTPYFSMIAGLDHRPGKCSFSRPASHRQWNTVCPVWYNQPGRHSRD